MILLRRKLSTSAYKRSFSVTLTKGDQGMNLIFVNKF